MVRQRLSTLTIAAAVGFSSLLVPSANAAEVDPTATDGCSVYHSDAERNAANRAWEQTYPGYMQAAIDGVDAAYPGAKKILTDYREDPAVKQQISLPASQRDRGLDEPYAHKLNSLGISFYNALGLLVMSRVIGAQTKVSGLQIMIAEYRVKADANAKTLTLAEYEAVLVANIKGIAPPAKQPALEKAMRANPGFSKYAEASLPFVNSNAEAARICVTALKTGKSQNFKIGNLNSNVYTPLDKLEMSMEAGSSADENGELSPGAIVGIIVAALVVLGIGAVVAAPMLGIQLPSALPF